MCVIFYFLPTPQATLKTEGIGKTAHLIQRQAQLLDFPNTQLYLAHTL